MMVFIVVLHRTNLNNYIIRSNEISLKNKLLRMNLRPAEVQQLGKTATLIVGDIITRYFANIHFTFRQGHQIVFNSRTVIYSDT